MQIPKRPSFIDTKPELPAGLSLTDTPTLGAPLLQASTRSLAATRTPLGAGCTLPSGHPSFFGSEAPTGGGWYYLALPNTNIFGYYAYIPQDPRFIYHNELGYEFTCDAGDGNGIFFYDFASTHWFYTSRSYAFPYLYDFTLNSVVFYYADGAHPGHYQINPRWFHQFSNDQDVTIPSAQPVSSAGFLIAAPGGLNGVLNSVTIGATFVGISGNQVTGGPSVTIPTASIDVSIGATVLSSQRAPQSPAFHEAGPHGAIDAPLDDAEKFRALQSGLRHALGAPTHTRRTRSIGTTIDSTNQFWVSNFAIGSSSGAYNQRPATLKRITTNGYIWIDNTLTALLSDDAKLNAVAADFENAYVSDTTHFGRSTYASTSPGMLNSYGTPGAYRACDSNGDWDGVTRVPYFILPPDSKIHVLVVDLDANALGSGVGGYFTGTNHYYQAALNCLLLGGNQNGTTPASQLPRSNEAPMIVVGYSTTREQQFPTYETNEDLVRGTAHEFQHLVNFVNHNIVNAGNGEEAWINEGMSMVAQDLAVNLLFPGTPFDVADSGYWARQYLAQPQNYSLRGFTGTGTSAGYNSGYNCGSCYGFEYLFQRYLYERFGKDAYLKRMLGASKGLANIQQATGTDPTQTISEFAMALAGSGTGATSDPKFSLGAITLGSSYTDQFGSVRLYRRPAAQPLGAGTYTYQEGSFFFLNGDATAAGKTITAKEVTGAFQLRAGVVQY